MLVEEVTLDNGQRISRSEMRVDGEVWPFAVNHTKGAVKVGDVAYTAPRWAKLLEIPDVAGRRAAHRAAQAIDGKLLTSEEGEVFARPDAH